MRFRIAVDYPFLAACLALAAVANGAGRSVTADHSPRVCFLAGKAGPA